MIRPVVATGIESVDEILQGGLPIGAVSELVGPECSGRTSLALSFLARMTQASKVCAWVDVSDTFDPSSAAASGVDLTRVLWVRCGVLPPTATNTVPTFSLPDKYLVPAQVKRGLHGGGCGPHPRGEVKGLSQAVSGLLQPEAIAHHCAEPQHRVRESRETFAPSHRRPATYVPSVSCNARPWSRIEQALRSTDLLLQAGGFSAIVLDMGSLTPEAVTRVPLATWFRYRAAAERTQSSILLLAQHPCAKSSAELLLRLAPGEALCEETSVFSGLRQCGTVERRRFTRTPSNLISMRNPVQNAHTATWHSRAIFVGQR
jgi:hypothetical protein